MPIQRCKVNGRLGYKWGNQKCYTGKGARARAQRQARAIRAGGYVANQVPSAVSPVRLDPTRTTTLRRAFMQALAARYNALRREVVRLVEEEDAFGLVARQEAQQARQEAATTPPPIPGSTPDPPPTVINQGVNNGPSQVGENARHGQQGGGAPGYSEPWVGTGREGGLQLSRGTEPVHPSGPGAEQIGRPEGQPGSGSTVINQGRERWRFNTDPQKVKEFEDWLASTIGSKFPGDSRDALYARYIEEGYQKGAARAFDDTRKSDAVRAIGKERIDFYAGNRDAFLRSSFAQPESREKVELLVGRTFTDLKGVNDQMATTMSRTLADGLTRGQNPREMARTLAKQIDIGRKRAETIARTEIIRAHAEGQLNSFERLGVERLGVAAEWSTAGDTHVCDLCGAMEGSLLTVEEAKGLIPRHSNCRCSWIPANVGEPKLGQKDTRSLIEKAMAESIAKEGGKDKSSWAGIDKKIDRVRPKPLIKRMTVRKRVKAEGVGKGVTPPKVPKVPKAPKPERLLQDTPGGLLAERYEAKVAQRTGLVQPTKPLTQAELKKELQSVRKLETDRYPARIDAANPDTYDDRDRNAMRNLLDPYVKAEGRVQTHGMATAEEMFSVEIDGVKYMWSKSTEHQAMRDLHGLMVTDQVMLPGVTKGVNQRVIWATGNSAEDAYWQRTFNDPNHISAATAGDGSIVVYSAENKGLAAFHHRPFRKFDEYLYAHETGHNYAKSHWGSVTPPANLTDDYYYASQLEKPLTPYGANNGAEDFAESFRLYVNNPQYLKDNAPLKFQAIDDMVMGRTPPTSVKPLPRVQSPSVKTPKPIPTVKGTARGRVGTKAAQRTTPPSPAVRPSVAPAVKVPKVKAPAKAVAPLEPSPTLTSAKLNKALKAGQFKNHDELRDFLYDSAKPVGKTQAHGMAAAEEMVGVKIDGVWVKWVRGGQSEWEALNFLEGRALGSREIGSNLWKSNKSIVFSTQDNAQDAYWKVKYNSPEHVSAATGGDGNIVVYGSRSLDRGTLAHESGHNIAAKTWSGNVTPTPGTTYANAQLAEGPVSAYGAKSAAEDFAEACRLYVENKEWLRTNFPEKFKVIDFMIEGNLPPGGF